MVAYQGDVSFEHAGSGGMGRFIKKAVSGEGTSLMKASGTGEMFLADTAQDIHLIKLENDAITCNGANVLAFDAGHRLGHHEGQRRHGRRDGGRPVQHVAPGHRLGGRPLRRPARAAEHRRRADVRRPAGGDHLVERRVHQHQVRLQAKDLIGKGSGEQMQMAFQGQGWVLVQPSEGRITAMPAGGGGGGGLLGQLGG